MSRVVQVDSWTENHTMGGTIYVDVDLSVQGELPEALLGHGTRTAGFNAVPAPEQNGADDAMEELLEQVERKPPGELRSVSVNEQHMAKHNYTIGTGTSPTAPAEPRVEFQISATYNKTFGDATVAEPAATAHHSIQSEGGHPAQAAGSGNVGMSYVCATCDAPIQRSNADRIERGGDHYCNITCLNEALQTQ